MKKRYTSIGLMLLIAGVSSFAAMPYAGQEKRSIKALSDSQLKGYLSGSGMGMAKAAELNRYPGPKHVLELADKLGLTDVQRRATEKLFRMMRSEAVSVGGQLVARERELDRLFASGKVTTASLKARVEGIGVLKARLRYVHLKAHLAQKKILTRHQVQQYQRLRGYNGGHAGHSHHNH